MRATLASEIRAKASGLGVGIASVEEIDCLNIYHAALLAMRRAVEALPRRPQHVLVDARTVPGVDVPQNAFNKGDGINFTIAAASIIAKTERDRMMDQLDRDYPGYGFASHKGYGTPEHRDALLRLGPSAVHRMSFPVIHELRGEYSPLFYTLRGAHEGGARRVRDGAADAGRKPSGAGVQKAAVADYATLEADRLVEGEPTPARSNEQVARAVTNVRAQAAPE
jgi:ribonuclease HII